MVNPTEKEILNSIGSAFQKPKSLPSLLYIEFLSIAFFKGHMYYIKISMMSPQLKFFPSVTLNIKSRPI
jgi:hypothetical protein